MASLRAGGRLLSRRSLGYVLVGSGAAIATGYYILNPARQVFPPPPPGGRPPPPWTPPTRAEMLTSLRTSAPISALRTKAELLGNEEFDLLVIGGGATGSGVAVDAASRGLKVALVERDDFSSGTSSKSTKLVHGGVRYLQKAVLELDYEQYKLVREALQERRIFLQTAPYLSHMLPIMLPIYKWWQLPWYWAGCKAYDALAGRENMESSYIMTKGRALEAFPVLKSDGLVGALVYYDGQHNDSRMNVSLIMTAAQHGATVVNHTEVISLFKQSSGQLCGARVQDCLTGEVIDVRAKGIINATGPFSDNLLKMDAQTPASASPTSSTSTSSAPPPQDFKPIVAPSSGVHITLPNYYSPRTMGLLDPATSDGRVIFFLPWQGNTIAGTTDTPVSVEHNPIPKEDEIQWILDEIQRYLSPDIKVRRGDVLSAWSGLRPLIRDPNSSNSKDLVRSHLVSTNPSSRMITIAGGKWTTYRRMAEECVDEAVKVFGFDVGRCETEKVRLVGSEGWSQNMFIGLVQRYGLETEVAKHLADNYGDRAWAVASMAETSGKRWPLHGVRLNPNYPYIEAEVLYAVRSEYACTPIDVLGRRTRLAFLNSLAALDALPRVIDIMSEELGWDAKRRKKEWIDTRKWLVSMGLEELGALEEDRKFMNESESRWSWDPLNWIQDKGSTARPVPVAHISHSRAHFSLDELEALKDIFAERTSAFAALQSAPVDDTLTLQRHGLPADIVLEVIRDDLGYVDASKLDGTGTKNVHKALMKVGVKDANKQGRLISFDEFVDVAALFKESASKSRRNSVQDSNPTRRTVISVENSGGGV